MNRNHDLYTVRLEIVPTSNISKTVVPLFDFVILLHLLLGFQSVQVRILYTSVQESSTFVRFPSQDRDVLEFFSMKKSSANK